MEEVRIESGRNGLPADSTAEAFKLQASAAYKAGCVETHARVAALLASSDAVQEIHAPLQEVHWNGSEFVDKSDIDAAHQAERDAEEAFYNTPQSVSYYPELLLPIREEEAVAAVKSERFTTEPAFRAWIEARIRLTLR